MLAKCPDTARFRADFTFCAVETGLAGCGGRIQTSASQNRSAELHRGSTGSGLRLEKSVASPILRCRGSNPPAAAAGRVSTRVVVDRGEHLLSPVR